MELSRRDFTRLLALSGSSFALWPGLPTSVVTAPLPATPAEPDEAFWKAVRARFILPDGLVFLNAANLCPTSAPVLEALERNTRFLDADPSSANRAKLNEAREESRRLIAAMLRVAPEEVIITRNTSEANNMVSSGLTLGPSDEVVVFADNHPSNLAAWREKARRFGFTVVEVARIAPHPGPQAYLDAFARAMTPRTRVVAFTHLTNTVGDLFPAAELCALARARGALSLVDGAQTFGVLDVDLSTMKPDFFSGSAHKWPCGPKETGVLYVSQAVQDRLAPSIVSLYAGTIGISKTHEGFGQRDEAALATLGAAIRFQNEIGRPAIEKRARELTTRLATELRKLPGVEVVTDTDAERSAAVLVFRPGSADPRKVAAALYEKERVASAVPGYDKPIGVRFSPHFYNTMEEIDRAVAAVKRVMNG